MLKYGRYGILRTGKEKRPETQSERKRKIGGMRKTRDRSAALLASPDSHPDPTSFLQTTLEADRAHRDTRLAEIQAQRSTDTRSDPTRPRRGSPDVKRPEGEATEEVVKMDESTGVVERERSENVEMEDARGDEDAVEY